MLSLDLALQEAKGSIESALEGLFASKPTLIEEAARYSLFSGGKRLRPLFTLFASDACQGLREKAMLPALSIELLHTYSLIHDDLPCMDDDDYRRGKLTLHRVYSEGIATLAGDFLLTYAFEVLAKAPLLEPEQKVDLISLIANRCGSNGMIGGQVLDIQGEKGEISSEILQEIHLKKTAALIEAALLAGAIAANASKAQEKQLSAFAQEFGLAFQIADDILDVTQSMSKHGKQKSVDESRGKKTYVTLFGLEGALALFQERSQRALQLLEPFGKHSLLYQLASKLLSSDLS
ncbi:MAG: crtE [Chlamydiales bacterium]|jgi:geranylgeranyl diphosphate synthase type II|nr:crtE [Chlamydiales bacterium]